MTEDNQTLFTNFCRFLEEQQDAIRRDWKTLVNLEGRADEKEALEKTAAFLKTEFEAAGLTCSFLEAGSTAAPFLCGTNVTPTSPTDTSSTTAAATKPPAPVLFTGHYDTVFASGSRGDQPFHIKDGKAYGPGVLDMKGGIIITLYIIKGLQALGLDIPVKIAFCGDEESGHLGTCSPELFIAQARGCRFAFNMETGFEHRSLCTSRKGTFECEVTVHGVSSHPGNAFHSGRNAIEEMAHKVIALQQLTPADFRYTISVNTISGGTANNIIPGLCRCLVEVRGTTLEALDEAERQILAVCRHTYVEGTTTEVSERAAYMPPFERSAKVAGLLSFVQAYADQYSLPIPGEIALGGCSDASYLGTAGADIPVLCSCGVCGALSHTEEEYALTESLAERAKLFFAALLERNRFPL